jgi:hypothetical protein
VSDTVNQVDVQTGSFQNGGYSLGDSYQPTPGNTAADPSQSQPVMIQPRGALAGIVADAIVHEAGRDTLRLTDSPVERTAAITDHAFMEPVELEVELGFSNSGNGLGYVQAVYAVILGLQASRIPFSFTTGKRLYQNMLITSIGQVTEEKTENALHLHVTMREVILVSTQASTLPPSDQQSMPQSTADTTTAGDKQPLAPPANNDTLAQQLLGGGTGYTQTTGSTPQ